jgi:hypothetical protein
MTIVELSKRETFIAQIWAGRLQGLPFSLVQFGGRDCFSERFNSHHNSSTFFFSNQINVLPPKSL